MMMHLLRSSGGVSVALPGGYLLALNQIIGIGRNYADHAKEMGSTVQAELPIVFTKSSASACLHGDEIVIPKLCQDDRFGGEQVDFEGELAVIIGSRARNVSKAEAMKHVLGYTVANDVSARWWQKTGSGGQFFRGKSFDTFCPLGPHVVRASDVSNPGKLRLTTVLSGETMQDSNTEQMIFDVPTLVSDLSQGMTLLPGTVILTGTPSGVGTARKPPRYLRKGDVVEITIEQIGTLRNRVAREG